MTTAGWRWTCGRHQAGRVDGACYIAGERMLRNRVPPISVLAEAKMFPRISVNVLFARNSQKPHSILPEPCLHGCGSGGFLHILVLYFPQKELHRTPRHTPRREKAKTTRGRRMFTSLLNPCENVPRRAHCKSRRLSADQVKLGKAKNTIPSIMHKKQNTEKKQNNSLYLICELP